MRPHDLKFGIGRRGPCFQRCLSGMPQFSLRDRALLGPTWYLSILNFITTSVLWNKVSSWVVSCKQNYRDQWIEGLVLWPCWWSSMSKYFQVDIECPTDMFSWLDGADTGNCGDSVTYVAIKKVGRSWRSKLYQYTLVIREIWEKRWS